MSKVSHLQLHKPHFVPGILELKRTVNQQFYPGISMEMHHAGVLCQHKGVAFIIPYAAAESIVLDAAPKAEETKDAKASSRKS